MDQPRRSSRVRRRSDVNDRNPERRATVARLMEENREGVGMKVVAVMVQRYGVLPRDLWDLNSISDMGAARGITYDDNVSRAMLESIISNNRYSIVNLTLRKGAHAVSLPSTLRRLHILVQYNYPLDLPQNLQELSVGAYYKYSLVLPDNLQKLNLGRRYNKPITLPPHLVELELGFDFCQPLLLPPTLKRLAFHFNSKFNLPLALPTGLTSVQFGNAYDQPTALPSGIEELRIGRSFAHDLSLPNTLRKIDWCCNRPIQISEGVSEVLLRYGFDQPVILPASLKKFNLGATWYSHPIDFPTGLEDLSWRVAHYDGLVLPESLQKLTWESDRSISLPSGLRELEIRGEAPLVLPDGLLKVRFAGRSQHHYHLPNTVQEVVVSSVYADNITFTHPSTLQHLIVEHSYNKLDLSRNKIHKLTVGCSETRMKHWPQELKELEFTVDAMSYKMRVPSGVSIVGEKRPTNVVME